MKQKVKIKAFKHPNVPHYEWEGELLEETEDYVIVVCKAGRKLKHHTKNDVFTMKNATIEIFFKKEWFTVSAAFEKEQIKSYYCNIAKPSIYRNNEISFIDLDLDYVNKIGVWEVVDEEEFVENSKVYHYSQEMIEKAKTQLNALENRVEKKLFPFDGTIENTIKNIS